MSLLISILAVGLLIALHEGGHFFAARQVGMTVIKYSIGFFRSALSWTSKKTGTIYQIGILPFGGFVQIKGMNPFEEGAFEDHASYQMKSVWRRGLVIVAGPLANLLTAWVLLFGLYMAGHPEYVDEPRVGFTVPGGPAEKTGIRADDLVLTFNEEPLKTWVDLASRLHAHPDQEVTLEIRRGDENLEVKVVPKNKNGIGLIGIGQATQTVSLPLHIAAAAAVVKCAQIVDGIISAIGSILGGSGGAVQTVGPVGIVKMAATTLDVGVRQFLALVAYLSIMLALFNLLPLPALDGGRTVFLLYELVTRRRVSPKVDAMVSTVGFLLLVGLLLLMTVKEVFVD
ncbi:MAG: site-2 protease family protein [Proteobacteria bacterium]|nr:site-2 protease family protein [Pseudomonadota bacterium]